MATQEQKQSAIFPDLPRDERVIDNEGNMTAPYRLFFQQLVMALQTNFKPEGIVVPPKTATEIANLGNVNAAIGNIIYDITNNQFKGIVLVSLNPTITTTKTFTLV